MHYTTLICVEALQSLPSNGRVVVDCRFDLLSPLAGQLAYQQEHIPGAHYAHLEHDLSAPKKPGSGRHPLPEADALRETFSQWGISSGTQVVAYDDHGGMFAARLWWLLQYMGHELAAVLDGGLSAWRAAGGALESGTAPAAARAPFAGTPHRQWLVEVAQVLSSARLVDSRDPARYRGEVEPIDPVAGHIPGAINHFCKTNLAADGRFLPPAQLAEKMRQVIGDSAAGQTVFYCGSGVTACHNILAARHAGYAMPKLYAGSWSEWCADTARPVARG